MIFYLHLKEQVKKIVFHINRLIFLCHRCHVETLFSIAVLSILGGLSIWEVYPYWTCLGF